MEGDEGEGLGAMRHLETWSLRHVTFYYHNFWLYAQHSTKQFLKFKLPLYMILKYTFQEEAVLNFREKERSLR